MNNLVKKWNSSDEDVKNVVHGVILLVMFAFIAAGSSQIIANVSDGIVSATFFPFLVAGLGIGLSLTLVGTNLYHILKRRHKAEARPKTEPPRTCWGMIGASVLFMGIYFSLMNILGFVVSSVLYLFAQIIVLQDEKNKKTMLITALISILVPAALFIPFRYIFGIRLPLGIFTGIWG
ncbi:MAG: tripartite tricarboxylate transporter TctB family protein [Clostridiales bacterium]|jgi:putative tricarboxylic transport membrane protein|nr:tripartite tricarboxylate transporter TctB family protein [Clostridiales bacterium]